MNTTENKIIKSKIRLLSNHPFFASLVCSMTFEADSNIETASCDGEKIRYNETFINTLSNDHIDTLLAHEIMHPAMMHHTRQESREHKDWNVACDYAINPVLKSEGFLLPENALLDSRFADKSAEDIYNIIQREKKPDNQQQQQQPGQQQGQGQQQKQPSPGDWGQVEKPELKTESEKMEKEGEMKNKIIRAKEDAKRAGKLSAGIDRIVKKSVETRVNWKEVLNRFLAERAKNDYSFTRPNTRFIPSGLYLPVLENQEIGKVVFAIDTSGSVDEKLLQLFVSELREAAELFHFPVTVIHCDTKVNKVEELEQDNEDIHPVGGGGTDFKPPFSYVNDNDIDCKAMVYLTDGYCNRFPSQSPDFETLWAVYDNSNFNPPFGEVIYIDK